MGNKNTAKVHKPQGGDKIVVEPGGAIDVLPGGALRANGVQAAAIADHADPGSATAGDVATKQNAILAALRGVGVIAPS